jgi:hypothetical protein
VGIVAAVAGVDEAAAAAALGEAGGEVRGAVRLLGAKEGVDGRVKPGHDEKAD